MQVSGMSAVACAYPNSRILVMTYAVGRFLAGDAREKSSKTQKVESQVRKSYLYSQILTPHLD